MNETTPNERDEVRDSGLPEPSEFLPTYTGPARKLALRDLFFGKTTRPAKYRHTKNRNVYWQDWVRVTAAGAGVLVFAVEYGFLPLGVLLATTTAITSALRRLLP